MGSLSLAHPMLGQERERSTTARIHHCKLELPAEALKFSPRKDGGRGLITSSQKFLLD